LAIRWAGIDAVRHCITVAVIITGITTTNTSLTLAGVVWATVASNVGVAFREIAAGAKFYRSTNTDPITISVEVTC